MSAPNCPMCPGKGVLLGALGPRRWFRCRDCGIDFSKMRRARPARKISMDAAIWRAKLNIPL